MQDSDILSNDKNTAHKRNTTVTSPVMTASPAMSENMVMWAVGCTVFCVIVFILATVQYFRKRADSPQERKKRRLKKEQRRKTEEEKCITELSQEPALPANLFLSEIHRRRKKSILLLQYKALKRCEVDHTCTAGRDLKNLHKNAYPEVLPYDHCRVLLDTQTWQCESDYINASYINGHNKPKAYIAAQGPSRFTINDFWRMIWQECSYCIVMATNLFEHARQQCEKYWHNEHARYGQIDVWLKNTDSLADFCIRTFLVKKDGKERIIKQFQSGSWSDHECPNPSIVLEYRRRIQAHLRKNPGPLVVHCGAGAGRTGTFITIDAMLDRLVAEKNVDIFNFVKQLINCRQNMISSYEQYDFIHKTVAMYIQSGTTVIPAKHLPNIVHKMTIRDSSRRWNGFEREFKTLHQIVPKLSVGECAGGHRAENRHKSRDIMIQPPERARPYLMTHDSNDSTDYINAVYVDGYRHTNAYIVTQWPLRSTVNDIWRLIYDYNITTMVLLNDIPHSRSYPQFWPQDVGKSRTYGPLSVTKDSEEESNNVITRVFKIRKPKRHEDILTALVEAGQTLVSMQALASQGESMRLVKMFQLKCWPQRHKIPTSTTPLIELLSNVEDWQIKCHGRIPICVISSNGVSRCGVFVAVSIAWDKYKTEGEVDVFRAVQTIKMNRLQLVDCLLEYIYCYTFMVVLLEVLGSTTQSSLFSNITEIPYDANKLSHTYLNNQKDKNLALHSGGYTDKYLPFLHSAVSFNVNRNTGHYISQTLNNITDTNQNDLSDHDKCSVSTFSHRVNCASPASVCNNTDEREFDDLVYTSDYSECSHRDNPPMFQAGRTERLITIGQHSKRDSSFTENTGGLDYQTSVRNRDGFRISDRDSESGSVHSSCLPIQIPIHQHTGSQHSANKMSCRANSYISMINASNQKKKVSSNLVLAKDDIKYVRSGENMKSNITSLSNKGDAISHVHNDLWNDAVLGRDSSVYTSTRGVANLSDVKLNTGQFRQDSFSTVSSYHTACFSVTQDKYDHMNRHVGVNEAYSSSSEDEYIDCRREFQNPDKSFGKENMPSSNSFSCYENVVFIDHDVDEVDV